MNQLEQPILAHIAQQLGITSEELIKQSLTYYLERKLKEWDIELLKLKNYYDVEDVEEFEKLYETGEIDENTTWKDYQKFYTLTHKEIQVRKILRELIKKF